MNNYKRSASESIGPLTSWSVARYQQLQDQLDAIHDELADLWSDMSGDDMSLLSPPGDISSDRAVEACIEAVRRYADQLGTSGYGTMTADVIANEILPALLKRKRTLTP